MKKLILFYTLLFCSSLAVFSQSDILIIDYNNAFSSDRSMNNSRVYNYLQASHNVTRINSIPASISAVSYDQCWIYGNPGTTTPAILNPIVNYINSGGSVYIQSEVSCCNLQAALAQAVMRAVVAGGSGIVHNPTRGSYYRFQTGAGYACPGITHYGAAVRPYTGMTMTNALWRGATGCGSSVSTNDIVAVIFRSCDMTNGQGSFASAGDFNMFMQSSTCGGVGIIGTPNYTAMLDMVHDRLLEGRTCSPCGVVVLPVELTDFHAERVGDEVALTWTTTEERHLDYFTVERSRDEINFEEVTQVTGALNSNTELHYSATDAQPYAGYSYYRLKSTDTDGEVSYSEVRAVAFGGQMALDIFHVAAREELVILNLQEADFLVSLVNLAGQEVGAVEAFAGGQSSISTSELAPGVYLARVTGPAGQVYSQKVFVGR